MLKTIVEALNEINTNIWGFLLIVLGSIMVLRHADNVGSGLIGGGLSLLRVSSEKSVPARQVGN